MGRSGKLAVAVLSFFTIVYFGFDLYQHARRLGPYRDNWAGEIVSARPSVSKVVNWFSRGHSASRNRRGDYVASVKTDDGKTLEISLTYSEYQNLRVPSYVVATDGHLAHFNNRAHALEQHAIAGP